MSYYYSYYLGYRDDGKVYPLGPYDAQDTLHPVICRSRTFASDLHERFNMMTKEDASQELLDEFTYRDYKNESCFDVKYLNFSDLPKGDYIRKGYCLESDIHSYMENESTWDAVMDLRYTMLTEAQFAVKAARELKFGPPKPKKDEFDEEIPVYSCTEYMYFCFPDEFSEEYEADLIRKTADMFESSKPIRYDLRKIVVLLTEG